jgi:hypothetical protein
VVINKSAASPEGAAELAEQINAITGLTAEILAHDPSAVVVTGSAGYTNNTLRLDIPSGVTLRFRAVYAGQANPLVDITGGGALEVGSGAWIWNSGSGIALRAACPSVTIRDYGVVEATSGSAIVGSGVYTSVSVQNGGSAFNEAPSNLNPVINITDPGNTGANVYVSSGGSVFALSDSGYGYGIQTYGSVVIGGGAVTTYSVYGRAVNLVGMYSSAFVSGGEVSASGSRGVAISTATTAPETVSYTSVNVTGGYVYATTGMAIHTTGSGSTVSVTGGCVFAYGSAVRGNNNVIYTERNAGGFSEASAPGVAVAWNDRAYEYEAATNDDISASPPSASAAWALSAYGDHGIAYDSGGSSGFISLPVQVVLYAASVSPVSARFADAFEGYGAQALRQFTVTNRGTRPLSGLAAALEDGACFELIGDVSALTVSARPVTGLPAGTYTDRLVITGDRGIELYADLRFTVNPVYTVTVTHNAGGAVLYQDSPVTGALKINGGDRCGLVIAPDSGYIISDVKIDGASIGALSAHRFLNVAENHTVEVTFALEPPSQYGVTASAGPGGSISPAGTFTTSAGESLTFTVTPDPGYVIRDVLVDGEWIGPAASYTFSNIQDIHSIYATFTVGEFTITASAGAGGSISPAGNVRVLRRAAASFTVTPAPGYAVSDVFADGVSVGAATGYSFSDVTENHTIRAEFERVEYIITSAAGPGGRIFPEGETRVYYGEYREFFIAPEPGYRVADVLLDGVSVGAVNVYTLGPVTGDRALRALFVAEDAPSESPPSSPSPSQPSESPPPSPSPSREPGESLPPSQPSEPPPPSQPPSEQPPSAQTPSEPAPPPSPSEQPPSSQPPGQSPSPPQETPREPDTAPGTGARADLAVPAAFLLLTWFGLYIMPEGKRAKSKHPSSG